MSYIALFSFLFSFAVFAAPTWQEKTKSTLPAPLQEFIPGKTKLKDIEKRIGKAQQIKGTKYYWEFDKFKYALELTIQSKTLKSMHFTFTKDKPHIDLIQNVIQIQKFTPYPKEGKSTGRYLKLEENGSELIIDPVSKTIYSVRLP